MAASSSAFTGGGARSRVRGVTSAGLSCFLSGFNVGAAGWVPWAEMRGAERKIPPARINTANCTDFFMTFLPSVLRPLRGFSKIQVAQFLLGGLLGPGWGALDRKRCLIF